MSGTAGRSSPARRRPSAVREVQPVVAQRRSPRGRRCSCSSPSWMQHRPVAERLHGAHVVGDQHDRLARVALLVEDVHALLRERGVAHGEHLVDQHDVGVRLDHHREGQAHHHPRGVVLQLELDEVLELGELEDRVEPRARPRACVRPIRTPLITPFSRAVSSGLKPTPSSMNGASRPGHPDRPGVGTGRCSARTFSSVLLPEPFWPTIPKNSPWWTSNETSSQRLQLAVLDPRERVRGALLERVDAVLGDRNDLSHARGPRSPPGVRPSRPALSQGSAVAAATVTPMQVDAPAPGRASRAAWSRCSSRPGRRRRCAWLVADQATVRRRAVDVLDRPDQRLRRGDLHRALQRRDHAAAVLRRCPGWRRRSSTRRRWCARPRWWPGVATIPLVYLLGVRTVGSPAALVAAALTALSPFMIYYSAEARGYALMMALVALSTLAMLLAVDTRRTALVGPVRASARCAAVYTHYTCVFVLGRPARVAAVGPPARRAGRRSWPTSAAVARSCRGSRACATTSTRRPRRSCPRCPPFDSRTSGSPRALVDRLPVRHRALREVPGTPRARCCSRWRSSAPRPPLTVRLVRAATPTWLSDAGPRPGAGGRRWPCRCPLGELVAERAWAARTSSARATSPPPGRRWRSAWARCSVAAGPRLRLRGRGRAGRGRLRHRRACKMLDERYQRPDYRAAADFVRPRRRPGDVVVDATAVLSPGPLSPLDTRCAARHRLFRAARTRRSANVRSTLFDRIIPSPRRWPSRPRGARGPRLPGRAVPPDLPAFARPGAGIAGHPPGYRVVDRATRAC